MKRFLLFIFFIVPCYAEGPRFQQKDTFVNQEFENVYQSADRINSRVNSIIKNNYLNVKDDRCGAVGDGSVDDTAAFQRCLDLLPLGGTLFVPHPDVYYKITSSLNINVNRITIKGDGAVETLIEFIPTSNSGLFRITSGDNYRFEHFSVQQANPTTFTSCSGFLVSSGVGHIVFNDISFYNFCRFAINMGTCHYMHVENCRFFRIRDTTSTSTAFAINAAGNYHRYWNNEFSENDGDIAFNNGSVISFLHNVSESGGNSGNINVGPSYSFSNVRNLLFENNYTEGPQTNNESVLKLTNCIAPIVRGNLFGGQDENVDKSTNTIRIAGSSTRYPLIERNYFVEVTSYFIDASVPTILRGNYFYDNGAEITNRTSLMNTYMTDPYMIDIDMKDNLYFDPPSISSGTGLTSGSFVVVGSSTGDHVELYPPYSLQGLMVEGYVDDSTGTVRIRVNNLTTAAVNLSTGAWGAIIKKR